MGFRRVLADAVPENRVRFVGHPEHVHDVPHLIHMVMGRGHVRVDGETITLEPRTSLLLAPQVPHAMELDDHSIALGPFLSHRNSPVERVRRLGVVPEITHLMLARLAAQPYTDEQVDLFTESLDDILTDLHTDEFAAPMPVHPTARQIAAAAAVSTDTLETLCAEACISTRQTQRLFVEETGLPFHRWRTRRRLNQAIRALRGGSSTEGAARAAGYSGRSSLLRALSREAGVSIDVLRTDPLAHLASADRAGDHTCEGLPSTAITVSEPGATSV